MSSYLVTTQSVDSRTQESRVTISSVGTEDSGTYRCEASNLLSTVNMNTTLTVESESDIVACVDPCCSLHKYAEYRMSHLM